MVSNSRGVLIIKRILCLLFAVCKQKSLFAYFVGMQTLYAILGSVASTIKYPIKTVKMSRFALRIFVLISFTISSTSQQERPACKLLPDGRYRLQYTYNSIEKPSIISISNNKFMQCCSLGDTLRGNVTWLTNCYLILNVEGRIRDTSNSLHSMLLKSFGEPCLELKRASGDSIFFRTAYRGNMHITVNEGQLVRIK